MVRKLWGLGGQPGILMMGALMLPRASSRLTAPVGLLPLAGTPPQAEQEPMAMTAAASAAARRI
ncbi:hypothetical protein D3C78_1798650 [compost metagenome]